MSKNYKVNKSVLNYIHARDFFPEEDSTAYRHAVIGLKYEPMMYGMEIPRFNMVWPDVDMLFGEMLGDYVKVVKEESGTFRVPWDVVHFEEYDSLNEWRMAVALEDTTFIVLSHVSGVKNTLTGEYAEFDYNDPDQWVVESYVNLRENDAVFYRPWLFHKFESKLIHCYKLLVEE